MPEWWEDWKRKWGGSDDEKFREENPQWFEAEEKYGGTSFAQRNPEAIKMMQAGSGKMGLEKRQKLFQLAAEGGAQDGGPAIGGGGTSGIGYAPQRDITKTFPGAMSKEEEEYLLALRGPVPGMMTYRGMS